MGFYCSYGAQSRTIQGIKHTFLPRQTSISYRFLHILSCPFLKPGSPAVPYGAEFAGRHNIRLLDTLDRMLSMVAGMVGKRLPYKVLVG